jgi:hypothetical protein
MNNIPIPNNCRIGDLEQTKYLLTDIFIRQKALDNVQNLILDFHSQLSKVFLKKRHSWISRTHIRGITCMVNENKAFLMIDIHQEFFSCLFFTGNNTVQGLTKANWLNSGDNMGCRMFRVKDGFSLGEALKYAGEAYKIAFSWVSNKSNKKNAHT